ncbi:hypothetical protein JW960_04410 [candidate division KSB1 bacterium]|nr:hypothetical protein [candidate division KSB1 bacterium]
MIFRMKLLSLVLPVYLLSISPVFAENARIIRDERMFEIFSQDKATYTVHKEIIIFNTSAINHGRIFVNKNQFIEFKKLNGKIRDISGQTIKKLKNDDIKESDYSADYILYDDMKLHWAELTARTFP